MVEAKHVWVVCEIMFNFQIIFHVHDFYDALFLSAHGIGPHAVVQQLRSARMSVQRINKIA